MHGVDLRLRIGRAGVDDVDEQIGLGHHLQGALEGLDEAVGQTADESDRVGHEDGLTTREREAARGRVEGGEEPVSTRTPAAVSRFSNVDLPAFV